MGAPIVILGDKPVRAILVHEKGSFTNIWHIWHLVLVLGLGLGPLLAPRRLLLVNDAGQLLVKGAPLTRIISGGGRDCGGQRCAER